MSNDQLLQRIHEMEKAADENRKRIVELEARVTTLENSAAQQPPFPFTDGPDSKYERPKGNPMN